jgi:GT2 family glycosyltransferase
MHPAVDNLYAAKEVLDELGLTFWLEAGTLLLAYRDGKVDETDIDISVYDIQKVEDNLDKFYDKGFVLGHKFEHPTGLATEISLSRNNIKLDVWTKEFRDGQGWWLSYKDGGATPIPHHVDEKHFKTLDTLDIWGHKWNIPSETEEFLTKVYGDWRTPNPNWRWWCDPVCIDYSWEIKEQERTEDLKTKKQLKELRNVTAIISNFLRPAYTRKCVESLKENFPEVRILVGNQDKPDKELELFVKENGGEYIELPFDCGITTARNLLVNQVKTKYVLIGDDDFYYTPWAHLEIMLEFMQKADICGGRIYENGKMRDYQGFIRHEGSQLIYNKLLLDAWKHFNGYRYKDCDLTFNFFITKTSIAKEIHWDEKIKISYEHSDWFLSIKDAGYSVIFTPHCVVNHKPKLEKEFDKDTYAQFRNRRMDRDYFFEKRNLESCIDMSGFMDVYKKETIDN